MYVAMCDVFYMPFFYHSALLRVEKGRWDEIHVFLVWRWDEQQQCTQMSCQKDFVRGDCRTIYTATTDFIWLKSFLFFSGLVVVVPILNPLSSPHTPFEIWKVQCYSQLARALEKGFSMVVWVWLCTCNMQRNFYANDIYLNAHTP